MSKINIGFIGAGNMGFAIIKGIFGTANENISLYAFDMDCEKLNNLKQFSVQPCSSEADVVKHCKYVVLAVKPQVIDNVLDNISDAVNSDTVIISIAAGITSDFVQKKTKPDAKVVLVMPNTPLLLGEGASALSHNEYVNDEEF